MNDIFWMGSMTHSLHSINDYIRCKAVENQSFCICKNKAMKSVSMHSSVFEIHLVKMVQMCKHINSSMQHSHKQNDNFTF